jgi:hypothetical protein
VETLLRNLKILFSLQHWNTGTSLAKYQTQLAGSPHGPHIEWGEDHMNEFRVFENSSTM